MSSESVTRKEILRALNQESRRSSAYAVLFNQAVAARVGLHPTDLKVVSLLAQNGDMKAGQLAEHTGLTTGAITFIIDRLESAGYVRRVRHPEDRRSILVALQQEQTMRVAKFFTSMEQVMERVGDHYTNEELVIIVDFITRANEAIQQAIAQMPDNDVIEEPSEQ
jgi:DNA-binding MarR family transcriptional regulator